MNTFFIDLISAGCDIDDVLYEYHVLAYHYGWPYETVRRLPHTLRQVFCHKVKKQIEAENGKKENPLENASATSIKSGKPYKESGH